MQSIAVFPLHDKDGSIFCHLQKITPDLKNIFEKVFISVTPPTLELQKGNLKKLSEDAFFELIYNQSGTQVGDHFLAGFRTAAERCRPGQLLHLCTLDRLAYILQTNHKTEFLKDIAWGEKQNGPVLFQRSVKAWSTHPKNYYALESASTRVGEVLYHKTLGFTWCHLAIKPEELKRVLPLVKTHDLTALAEIVIILKDKIITKEVDWLSWEDPFIFGKNPKEFKEEREKDTAENEKRLNYIIPTIKILLNHS